MMQTTSSMTIPSPFPIQNRHFIENSCFQGNHATTVCLEIRQEGPILERVERITLYYPNDSV